MELLFCLMGGGKSKPSVRSTPKPLPTTSRLGTPFPTGETPNPSVFSRYSLYFQEKHYLCPEKTNAMNAKAIANPHIQHQRIANSLERKNTNLQELPTKSKIRHIQFPKN